MLLICGDRAWSSYPFFPSCWRADSARAPTSYLVGSSLRLGQWAGPGLGKGQAALSSAGCQSGCSPSPSDSQLGEKPQHYLGILRDSSIPMAQDPPPLVTLTSGSEPCSDQITMMSIWGWVGKGGVGGMEPTFSVFCIVCFLQHVTNQYLVNIVSRSIDLTLVFLVFLWQFIRPYISSLFFLKLI